MMNRRRDEGGAAALEFALVLPILLTVLFGMINFGVFFAQSIALDNAAREGARYGVVRGHDCTAILEQVNASAVSLAMDSDSVDVDISGNCGGADGPCTGSASGDRIVVTTTHTYELLVPMLIPGFPDSLDVEGHGEFRCEYS